MMIAYVVLELLIWRLKAFRNFRKLIKDSEINYSLLRTKNRDSRRNSYLNEDQIRWELSGGKLILHCYWSQYFSVIHYNFLFTDHLLHGNLLLLSWRIRYWWKQLSLLTTAWKAVYHHCYRTFQVVRFGKHFQFEKWLCLEMLENSWDLQNAKITHKLSSFTILAAIFSNIFLLLLLYTAEIWKVQLSGHVSSISIDLSLLYLILTSAAVATLHEQSELSLGLLYSSINENISGQVKYVSSCWKPFAELPDAATIWN